MTTPDPQAILRALGQPAAPCQPISGGADTLIWRVEARARPSALRVFRPEQARVAAVEARVMRWLKSVGFPVPTVRALGEHADRPALLMDWLPGEPLTAVLTARLDQAAFLGAAFGRTLARLHALEVPPACIEAARSAGGVLDVAGAPPPARLSVLHLDYHPLNVLVQGQVVTGVIDWANVRLGDGRADVARSLAILSIHPGFYTLSGAARVALRAFRRAFLVGYGARSFSWTALVPFLTWAGTQMQSEMKGRLDARDLARIGRWTALWRVRAGESPSALSD